VTTLPGANLGSPPIFPISRSSSPNLVPAAYVAQDLLFNKPKCDVTAKTSTVSGRPTTRPEPSEHLHCMTDHLIK
jgi:hypothetical protein